MQTWRGFVWFCVFYFLLGFSISGNQVKPGPRPKYSTGDTYGFIMGLWVQNLKDHIKTLLTDTHWVSYEVNKILFHYCSGDS